MVITILIIVFGIIFLHIIFHGWYTKGRITNGYFFIDKEKQELYLINNYGNMYFSRFSGSSEIDRMYVEKFDLKSLTRRFETKLATTGGDFLKNDPGQIIGTNNQYLYYGLGDYFLLIVNMETGERVAKKKDILTQNPEIQDFKVSECLYSSKENALLIQSGESFLILDPKMLKLKLLDRIPDKNEGEIQLPKIDKIATMDFHKMSFTGAQYRDFYSSGNLHFHCSEEPGTVRMYIDFSWKERKGAIPDGEKTSFLYPCIIGYNNDEYCSVLVDTPSIIVAHTPELNAPAREIRISLVQRGSKVLWNKKAGELFVNPKFGKYSKLSYMEFENSILFILQSGQPHRISMSIVDKKTGKILHGPMRSINRRILKI